MFKKLLTTRSLCLSAIIAALYAALTLLLAPISYGNIQCRVSEAFTVLPMVLPQSIPGLFVGCLIANIFSPTPSIWDIVFGSLTTLIAACGTYALRKKPVLAAACPVVANGVIVGLMLAPLGTAVYFTTNISKSAYDEIITALHNAFRWPVWVSKNATEATMLILSLLVRGPVGVTTVVTAFAFGPVLQKYMELLDKKKFKILQWEKF